MKKGGFVEIRNVVHVKAKTKRSLCEAGNAATWELAEQSWDTECRVRKEQVVERWLE